MARDITEDFQIDLSNTAVSTNYTSTGIAYDISIGGQPFVIDANNQNPYRRETAQYKKDQFDNSQEPGEQSLTGWWIRSQTSFHNGAGLKYYEPGTDQAHSSHRFYDSRGIDVWTVGEATMLPDVFHSYTGSNGIVATAYNNGSSDVILTGDSAGALKEIQFDGNNNVTGTGFVYSYTLFTGHTSSNPFYSVDTDGSRYFAVCDKAIHRGSRTSSDIALYNLGTGGVDNAIIKYTKGYLLFGTGNYLAQLDPNHTPAPNNHSGVSDLPAVSSSNNCIAHLSSAWKWTSIAGGGSVVYAAGYNNSKSEIWAIPYDDAKLNIWLPAAYVVAELPFGEKVNEIYYYLGYLVICTNKGIRIATVDQSGYQAGNITYGPLLFESEYPCYGIVANDRFVWISTTIMGDSNLTNACLVRVDLSTPFDDGTFPYAYDLQYLSDENSYGRDVYYVGDRLHMVLNEGASAGEIQTEHTTNKRTSGWLQTGYIRYSTVQPKYFKYIESNVDVNDSDTITISSIDGNENVYDLISLDSISSDEAIAIRYPIGKQELLAFKFRFDNLTPLPTVPKLNSYQVKSIPAMPRQRLIQYPLMCYDIEMDHFDNIFGYKGKAYEKLSALEELEGSGDTVLIEDYRTDEKFSAIIEEVRFTNESSTDRNNSGYGGVLLVTVRKL
jgi:disulfide oxidoreductase YuzD